MKRQVAMIVAVLAFSLGARATDPCDLPAAKKNRAWATDRAHSWLADVEHKQYVEVPRTWCHIWETHALTESKKP